MAAQNDELPPSSEALRVHRFAPRNPPEPPGSTLNETDPVGTGNGSVRLALATSAVHSKKALGVSGLSRLQFTCMDEGSWVGLGFLGVLGVLGGPVGPDTRVAVYVPLVPLLSCTGPNHDRPFAATVSVPSAE